MPYEDERLQPLPPSTECFLWSWVWFYILWGMEATECLLFLCDCCAADCAWAE